MTDEDRRAELVDARSNPSEVLEVPRMGTRSGPGLASPLALLEFGTAKG